MLTKQRRDENDTVRQTESLRTRGWLCAAAVLPCHRQIRVRDRKVRIGPECPLVVLNAESQLPRVFVDDSDVAQRLDVGRILSHGHLIVLHGQIEFATLRRNNAQIEPRHKPKIHRDTRESQTLDRGRKAA